MNCKILWVGRCGGGFGGGFLESSGILAEVLPGLRVRVFEMEARVFGVDVLPLVASDLIADTVSKKNCFFLSEWG